MLLSMKSYLTSFAICLFATGSIPATGNAETVEIRLADGQSYAARLAGDWDGVCAPTLILSHGLGGDERAMEYLDALAVAEGYRVLAMEHRDSGPRALFGIKRRGAIEAQLQDPAIWTGRARDLQAAIDYATKDCRPDPFVLGGHSMGAALTMIEAGAQSGLPFRGKQRFDAYIAVSPQGTGWAFSDTGAWADVTAPVLMLTGTEDDGYDGSWQTRLTAWEGLPPGQKRLAVIEGASHFNLGGRGNASLQNKAGRLAGEYLRHLRQSVWQDSALGRINGVRITEK